MHEKRRYGELVLHRVTAPMSNAEAKSAAADIRMDGYRARIDTWQGQFAVWSDKGLTDPTMPKRPARAVRRGRRPKKPSIQSYYNKISKGEDYPPAKFSFEGRKWGWKGIVWGPDAARGRKHREEVFKKQGYDVVWLSFQGSRISQLYISKWKDGRKAPKRDPHEYARATGHAKAAPRGVVGKLRGTKPPKTITYKGQRWTRDSCHLTVREAREFAKMISDTHHTSLWESGVGSYCIYSRLKTRKKFKKDTIEAEIFAYLDRLNQAGVPRDNLSRVLVVEYGMTNGSAKTFVRRWIDARQLDVKPPTRPEARGVSPGVYKTRAEARKQREKREAKRKKPPKFSPERKARLIDTSIFGGKGDMAYRAENIMRVRVDEVLGVRKFKGNNLLVMVRSGNQIKIYELLKGRTKRTKAKFTEKNLLDKFSAKTSQTGMERAFRREASRRGIK